MKIYATNAKLHIGLQQKIKEKGYKAASFMNVICKANSMAKANKRMAELGFGERVFDPKYTSVTSNTAAHEICQDTDAAIEVSPCKYVSIEDILR
jgi:hypothetical protein